MYDGELSKSRFNASDASSTLSFSIPDDHRWKRNLDELQNLKLIIYAENIPFRLLKKVISSTNLKLWTVLCKTMNFRTFSLLLPSQYYYTLYHITVSDTIVMVYDTPQMPPWGTKLLILMWKASDQWQVSEYSKYIGTLDSNRPTSGGTYSIVWPREPNNNEKTPRSYHHKIYSINHGRRAQTRYTHQASFTTLNPSSQTKIYQGDFHKEVLSTVPTSYRWRTDWEDFLA